MYQLDITTRAHYLITHITVRIRVRGLHQACPEISYDMEVPRSMIRASDGRLNRRVVNENLNSIVAHIMENYFYCIRTRVPGFHDLRRQRAPDVNPVNAAPQLWVDDLAEEAPPRDP